MKIFFNYAVPVALVCSVGTNSVGAFSLSGLWSWLCKKDEEEEHEEENIDNLRILYVQDVFVGLDANSFKPFPVLVKNFTYQAGNGNSYEVEVSMNKEEKKHPFKVVVRKIKSVDSKKDFAFWLLHGKNLPANFEENVKEWIDLKEECDAISEKHKEKREKVDDKSFFAKKYDMNTCAAEMNACISHGSWVVCDCEDGSMRTLGVGFRRLK